MSLILNNRINQLILVFIVAFLFCSSNIWGFPIYILDEAKNAEAAREMWLNNQWFVPTFNGELRTDKPPLHYFFMSLAFEFFGANPFSARLFSSLFGALTILSTFYFIRKWDSAKTAFQIVVVLLSSVFFTMVFHQAVPDPYLIFFVSFALFNFYDFHLNKKLLNWFLFYASLGFAVLSKGPIGLLLPGLIVLVFLINSKVRLFKMFEYRPILGLVLTLSICAPWFVLAHIKTDGAFTDGFFIQHNFQRFGSEMEGHGGIFLITLLFVLLGLLPFSFFMFQSFWLGFKHRKINHLLNFSWIVSLVWIVFFCISSTKLPNYTMPCYPFLAYLLVYYFNQVLKHKMQLSFRISLWVLAVISCFLPIASYIALTYAEPQLKVVNYVAFPIVFVSALSVFALYSFYKNQIKKSIYSLALAYLFLNFVLFFYAFPKLTSQSPVVLAKNEIKNDVPIILYKSYDPAFLFNFNRTFQHTESLSELKSFVRHYPNGLIITKKKHFTEELQQINLKIRMEQKSLFENYYSIILAKE